MEQNSRDMPAEPPLFAGEAWFDPIEAGIRERIRSFIEELLEEELSDVLGRAPRSTVNDYFRRWDYDGTLDRIHHALYARCRELAGRDASPDGGDHRQPERQERGKRCYGAGGEG